MSDDDSKDIIIQSQKKRIEELRQMVNMKHLQIQFLADKVESLAMEEHEDFENASATALVQLEFSAMLTRVQRMQNEIDEKKRRIELLEEYARKRTGSHNEITRAISMKLSTSNGDQEIIDKFISSQPQSA